MVRCRTGVVRRLIEMQRRVVNSGGAGQETAKGNLGGAGIRRDPVVDRYKQKLQRARRWARTIALLHAFSRFLAYCNLTWAMAVLLGAFASSLIRRDFAFVASLLLLEGGRLASAASSCRLLTRALAHLSQDPRRIDHSYDTQYFRASAIRLASPLLQLLFITPSLIIPLMALLHFHSLPIYLDSDDTRNLQLSLLTFYSLVAINALVALTQLVSSALATWEFSKSSSREQSVWRYFDKVLENAISVGVVLADEFEFFRFAYSLLAGEFQRNVQAEAVAKNHKELISYLYAERIGVDFLLNSLDSEEVFVRLAAANMVGFWADMEWGVGLEEGKQLGLSEELLTKLADMVGTAQVGWAAVNSIGILAMRPEGARLVQATHTSGGKPLVDRFVDLIDPDSSRSLTLVRSLVKFYERLSADAQRPPAPFADPHTTLVPKLKKMAANAKRHRLRVQAAYLLLIMGFDCDATVVSGIKPTEDAYWFTSEKSMLKLLQDQFDIRPSSPTEYPTPRNDADIYPPTWVKSR